MRAEGTDAAILPQVGKPSLPLFLVGSCRIPSRPRRLKIDRFAVATYVHRAMTDQPESLVPTLLREMRASFQRVEGKLDELVVRVSSVENNLAQVHVELAGIHVDLAAHSTRMDRMDRRLDRIEKRLGLIEA